MKAMILAAGYGTRLRPITYTLPKPMMPLGNRPLIAWAIESLMQAGIGDFIVNVHHLPQAIEGDLPSRFPDAHFEFSFERKILGTGGGLRKVRGFLEREEDFFLVNGDTVQFPPYEALRRTRRRLDSIAALTLRHPPVGDFFTPVWQENGVVTGFGSGRGKPLVFSGAHCTSSRIFRYLPQKDFSGIVDEVYQPLLQDGRETISAVIDDGLWFDIGTPQRYLSASRALCREDPIIGARSVIEGEVRASVVWDDCHIGPGVTLESCIVAHGVEIRMPMQLQNAIICRDHPAIPRDPTYRFENGLVIACI